jgi:SulP family sulfate permease
MKCGRFVSFFPRPFLIGTIGGVGWFLLATAVEISTRLTWSWTLDFCRDLFRPAILQLWSASLITALVLQLVQRRVRHSMLVPGYFMVITAVFYAILAISGTEISQARDAGWLLSIEKSDSVDASFYRYWTLIDFNLIHWVSIVKTIPTMLALTAFGLLHVPINVRSFFVILR